MTMDPQPSQASDLPAESNTVLPSAMTEPLPPAPTATMDDEKPGKPVPTNGAIVASTEAPSLPADGVVTRPPPNVVQSTFPAPTLKPATYTERPVPEDGGGDFPADPDATGSGEVPFQTATLVPVPVPPPARPTQMTDLLSSKASQAAGQPTGRPVGPVGPGDDIPIVPGNGANNNGANNNGAANNNAGDAAAESSSGPGKFIVVVPTEIADPTDPAAWDPNAPPASKPSRVRIPGQTYDSSDPYAIESAGGSTISNGPTVTIVLSMVGVAVVTVVVVLGILFWRKRHRKAEGRRVMLNESFGRMNRSKSDKSKGSRGPDDGDAPEMVEVSGENADEESVERDAREDVLAAFEDALGDETEGPFENKAGRGRKPPPPRIQTAQMVQRTNSYGPSIQFSSGSSGLQSMAEFSSGSSPTTLTNGYKSPSSAAGKKKVVTFMDSLIKPASAPVVQAPPRAALLQRTMSASAANGKGLVSSPALTKSASMGSRILHSSPLVMSSAASVMSDSTYDDDGCSVFSGMSGPMSIRNVQLEQGGRTLVALSAGVNRGRLELVVDEDASDASSDEEATAWEEPTANLVRKEPGRLVLHQVPTTIARSSPTLNATEVNRAASMEL